MSIRQRRNTAVVLEGTGRHIHGGVVFIADYKAWQH